MSDPTSKDDLKGTLLNTLDLVSYPEGGVVSRTILKSKGGNVTIFAFAFGEELSEHTAPFDALVQIIDGEAEISIAGKPNALKAGESIIMPADVPHSLSAPKPFKMILTMIKAKCDE